MPDSLIPGSYAWFLCLVLDPWSSAPGSWLFTLDSSLFVLRSWLLDVHSSQCRASLARAAACLQGILCIGLVLEEEHRQQGHNIR